MFEHVGHLTVTPSPERTRLMAVPASCFGIAVCSGNSSEDATVFDNNFLRVNHVVKTRFPRAHGHRLLAVAPPASTPSPSNPLDTGRRRRVDRAEDESV